MQTRVPNQPTQKCRSPGAKALRRFCVTIAIFVLGPGLASATTIYMYSDWGPGGSIIAGQSYNGTRAVDVTVLSPLNLEVSSMTLYVSGSGLAKAVIYDSNTHLLVASAQGTLTGSMITLPISATLFSGGEYRIGFFDPLGSENFFQPGSFPYIPSYTTYDTPFPLLQINSAWQIGTDSFPTNPNLLVPEVTMQVSAVPEPETSALVGLGLTLSMLSQKQRGREREAG